MHGETVKGKTLLVLCKIQSLNAVRWSNRCLFWYP